MKNTIIAVLAALALLVAAPAFAQDSSGSADADAVVSDVSASISTNVTNYPSDLNDGRGFAIPGEVIFPGTPGYFGEATPGHRFIPLNKLLMSSLFKGIKR